MQEFQPIPGLAGRLFGGAAAAGDLRRAHQAHGQQGPVSSRCGGAAPPEAVKCPRCDSTNTKFCYYNNYNLSQPRHFCKSCRRYWTKGGVLRNVPVGGGCRKAKRSAPSSSSTTMSPSAPSTPTSSDAKNPRRGAPASSPRSNSSGSASPTATAMTTPTATVITIPTSTPATPSSNGVAAFPSSSGHHPNPFSAIDVAPPAPIFEDQAAALASLFVPPPPPPLPVFTFAAAQLKEEAPATPSELQFFLQQQAAPAGSVPENMAPFASQLDAAEIFELGDAASAAAYWNAGSCWTTDVQDPSMYLP